MPGNVIGAVSLEAMNEINFFSYFDEEVHD